MTLKKAFTIFFALFIGINILLVWSSCNKLKKNEAVPSIETVQAYNITSFSAVSGGNVTSDGGSTVTSRGVCWSTTQSPVISGSKTVDSSGMGSFKSTVTGLISNTKYYLRAYATNSTGTGYGNEITFTTSGGGGTVTDIDGNVYHTIIIGEQICFIENLKVTHYRQGDSIPKVTDGSEWIITTKGAYSVYDKNDTNAEIYGFLYNWYAVNDTRGICPDGWHIPKDSEWQTLVDYLGGKSVAGSKMKSVGNLEQGTGLWRGPNADATNESGFTALPGGYRNQDAAFKSLSSYAYFWSSSENSSTNAWSRILSYKNGSVENSIIVKPAGLSIRCVKD